VASLNKRLPIDFCPATMSGTGRKVSHKCGMFDNASTDCIADQGHSRLELFRNVANERDGCRLGAVPGVNSDGNRVGIAMAFAEGLAVSVLGGILCAVF
jgi:hypothetical protein